MLERISALSLEYVYADVSAVQAGVTIDPTSHTVEIAVKAGSTAPSSGDWKTASWVTNTTTVPPTYSARLLIGPGSNNVTLTAGTDYTVWARITSSPELPVLTAGQIRAY